MRKLTLSEWAAVGEMVGTVAVFVSLIFVVFSIRQNTAAIHGSTENILFERIAETSAQVIADPTLAAIIVKRKERSDDLTPVEAVRWEKYQLVHLDMWALAYNRHRRGLLATDQWEAWDGFFAAIFSSGPERMPREQWEALAYGYDSDFWQYVGTSLYSD